jgi:hypothetical protein
METANKKKLDSFYPHGLSDRQGGAVAVFIKDALRLMLIWHGEDLTPAFAWTTVGHSFGATGTSISFFTVLGSTASESIRSPSPIQTYVFVVDTSTWTSSFQTPKPLFLE